MSAPSRASRGRSTAAASGGRPSPVAAVASSTTQPSGSAAGRAGEVDPHATAVVAGAALVGEDAVGRVVEQLESAAVQRGRVAAQRQHGARQVQHRVRVGALRLDAARARLGRPRQPRVGAASRGRAPWSTGSARGSRRARRDRRRARAGTSASSRPSSSPAYRNGVPAQRQQQHGGGARPGLRAAQARAHARLVVVGEHPGRPALAHDLLDVRDARAPRARPPTAPRATRSRRRGAARRCRRSTARSSSVLVRLTSPTIMRSPGYSSSTARMPRRSACVPG